MRCACDVCTDVERQMRSREDGWARFSHPKKRQMMCTAHSPSAALTTRMVISMECWRQAPLNKPCLLGMLSIAVGPEAEL